MSTVEKTDSKPNSKPVISPTSKPNGRRYPWNEWFKMRNFILVKGVDYEIKTHGMAGMIRNVAHSPAYRLSVGVYILSDEKIRVKIYGPLGPKGENSNGRPKDER